jgi:hypothetical protein
MHTRATTHRGARSHTHGTALTASARATPVRQAPPRHITRVRTMKRTCGTLLVLEDEHACGFIRTEADTHGGVERAATR